jgi:hypothetical protein
MNEHAIPVLIVFLTVAGIAAVLLRRAFTTLDRQQGKPEAGSIPPLDGPVVDHANARSKP